MSEANDHTLDNYRSFLRSILIRRQEQNPRYSLRSFASSIGLQAPFLSMILNGKRQLSEDRACKLMEKLGLTADEERKFHLLVRLEHAANGRQRQQVLKELEEADPQTSGRRDLALDQFKLISEWYHYPLQLLVDLVGFDWSEENAAKALGISVQMVRDGLERLAALEMIEWKAGQKPIRTPGVVIATTPLRNEAVHKFHKQMLVKLSAALDTQTPQERYTGTLTLALGKSGMREVHRLLDQTISRISEIADHPTKEKKRAIFHANLNLMHIAGEKLVGDRK